VDPYLCDCIFFYGTVSAILFTPDPSFLEILYQQEFLTWNYRSIFNFWKWTKIGSRILIIDVPFKFSNIYFKSPDPSSDPRRRLRKFKSGFQLFYILLIFTSVACFSTFGEFFNLFWLMHLANFDTVPFVLRVGTVGTGVKNILSFIQSVLKVSTCYFNAFGT